MTALNYIDRLAHGLNENERQYYLRHHIGTLDGDWTPWLFILQKTLSVVGVLLATYLTFSIYTEHTIAILIAGLTVSIILIAMLCLEYPKQIQQHQKANLRVRRANANTLIQLLAQKGTPPT